MGLRASAATIALISCAAQAPLAPLPHGPLTGRPRAAQALSPREHSANAPTAADPEASRPATAEDQKLAPFDAIGGPGPLRLLAASSSGAWVAWCDATTNSAQLAFGSSSSVAIDDVLAQAPGGRYVVASRDGAAYLFDALEGSHVDLSELGLDQRRLRADYVEHRSLSFDAEGHTLAYVRRQKGTSQIVVRQLTSGSEQVYPPDVGEVFRLRLSADARYVVFDAIRSDTNQNGQLDWPTPEAVPGENACAAQALPRFRSYGQQRRGDALTRGVVSLVDGSVRDVPELLTPIGASLLLREQDGSLTLELAGKRSPLAPAACAGRVLFADADRGLVVATCAPSRPQNSQGTAPGVLSGKREVWLFGAGLAKNLHSDLYETATDRDAVVGGRLVPLYPGSEAALLDLEQRELLPLVPGSRVLSSAGTLALIWRENDVFRYDAQTKTEERLAHGVVKNPDLLRAGKSVLLSPFVIVGLNGPAFSSPPYPLALAESGLVLTGSSDLDGRASGSSSAIRGPLRWVDARLPPPHGPPR